MVAKGSARPQRRDPSGWTHLGREAGRLVVWVRGRHDATNATVLSQTLRRTAAIDDGDLIVDLSGVEFMGAATVDVIVSTRALLRRRLQLLTLRCPSPSARLALDSCGVAYAEGLGLFDVVASPTALGTWVAVPAADRADRTSELAEAAQISAAHDRASLGTSASSDHRPYSSADVSPKLKGVQA